MGDIFDDYKQRVQRRLYQQEDGPVFLMAEALFLPSFHPETLIRATSGHANTTFRLMTVSSNLWHAGERAKGEHPRRFQEVGVVSSKSAERFWNSMRELNPQTIRAGQEFGADGMSVQATYRQGDALASFEAWSPDPASLPGKFVQLIYDLAWEVLKEPNSIERLEQLHGYLYLSLPARMMSGDVTCVRLFGSLASYHQPELQRLFESLPKDAPLVVDMTNFDGMGTLLYPNFVEFASKRRLLAWACSMNARRHIESMQMASPPIVSGTFHAVPRCLG